MADTQPAMTYPTAAQYTRWKQEAEDAGMSVSEFMQAMIEAGMKTVESVQIEPDETRAELRQERNRLKTELQDAHDTIDQLEQQTRTSEQQAIFDALDDDDGTEYAALVNAVIESAPERVDRHLDVMVGDEIEIRDGRYHAAEADQ